MSLKIERSKWLANRDDVNSLIGWFLLHSMKDGEAEKCVNTGEKFTNARGDEDTMDTITLQLNGVELDVTDCFKNLHDQVDDMVKRKATALLREKFDNVHRLLQDIEENLERERGSEYN